MLKISDLRCEYRLNPIGLDVKSPRLSWKLESDRRNCIQASYHVQLSHTPDFAVIIWDSQELTSDQSVHVELEGFQPAARTRYFYRVQVWDTFENSSGWSDAAYFEMGRMELSTDWTGKWITANRSGEPESSCPRMRRFFHIVKPVLRATIYATALGMYELHLNHTRVGEDYFTPGWTTYSKRLQYQTYEVTHQLKTGENVLGAYLGDGWYLGHLGWKIERENYGSTSALLMELHIRYVDGSEEIIGSNEEWSTAPSSIRMSDIYMGKPMMRVWRATGGSISRCMVTCSGPFLSKGHHRCARECTCHADRATTAHSFTDNTARRSDTRYGTEHGRLGEIQY